MKRIFTLATFFVLVLSATAQGYRKWDFTNWSATTIANLQAEAAAGGVTNGNWSDVEKSNGNNPTEGKCFWSYAANVSEDGYLMANGAVIAETEGLVWDTGYTKNRSLALAVDYNSAGGYAGPQYMWLGSKNKTCFTIPKVRIGQKITITVESHKTAEARGIKLFVNSTDAANQLGEAFTPTTQETNTWENWTLPEGLTVDGETVDIIITNTNGCHIYNIEVGDESQKSKLGYLYNGNIESELAYKQISSNEKFVVEAVEGTGAFTMDALTAYDAIVISSSLNNAEAISSLKSIQPFVPTLNLNPALYEAWGYGAIGTTEHQFALVLDKSHALFRDLELVVEGEGEDAVVGLPITSSISFKGVTLGNYFAADKVLATVMTSEDIAIHGHNLGHNGYLFIPYTQEALADAATPQILNNAITVLANSKAKVSSAPKPVIKLDYKNQNTNVTISSNVPQPQIFYTIDGTEPTEQSLVYSEPFNISTAGITVKAVVKGDGYLLSEVSEMAVDLKDQAPMPLISESRNSGSTVVTLSSEIEGMNIYYNYEGITDSTKSTKYVEPIVLMTNKTLTAFAGNDVYVISEPATKDITIDNPIVFTKTLMHMDANKETYYDLFYNMEDKPNTDSNSKVAYFFSWGKSKTSYPYYDESADPIEKKVDPETGDTTYVYPKNKEEFFDFKNGWAVRSRGHVICTEITIKPGTDIGNGSTYNPATVDEFEFSDQYPVTDFYVNISEWNTIYPRSGMIYTTQKVKGPFAVLSYISNGNAGVGPKVVFETGQDIEGDAVDTEWQQIGDSCILDKGQRLYQKFIRIYQGEDEVYLRTRIADGGSKAGFYDIYVLSIDPSYLTGIEEVSNKQIAGSKNEAIYNLNGVRVKSISRGMNIIRDNKGVVRKVMVK